MEETPPEGCSLGGILSQPVADSHKRLRGSQPKICRKAVPRTIVLKRTVLKRDFMLTLFELAFSLQGSDKLHETGEVMRIEAFMAGHVAPGTSKENGSSEVFAQGSVEFFFAYATVGTVSEDGRGRRKGGCEGAIPHAFRPMTLTAMRLVQAAPKFDIAGAQVVRGPLRELKKVGFEMCLAQAA